MIVERQNILEANERSICQNLELFSKTSDNKAKLYCCTGKSHTTLFPKITRCCWRATKIYLQYSFKQARSKRDFIWMNQKSRQNAKNASEKDFYKLMDNTNFGFDCRNSANNIKFEPIIDEISKFYNSFDNKFCK